MMMMMMMMMRIIITTMMMMIKVLAYLIRVLNLNPLVTVIKKITK